MCSIKAILVLVSGADALRLSRFQGLDKPQAVAQELTRPLLNRPAVVPSSDSELSSDRLSELSSDSKLTSDSKLSSASGFMAATPGPRFTRWSEKWSKATSSQKRFFVALAALFVFIVVGYGLFATMDESGYKSQYSEHCNSTGWAVFVFLVALGATCGCLYYMNSISLFHFLLGVTGVTVLLGFCAMVPLVSEWTSWEVADGSEAHVGATWTARALPFALLLGVMVMVFHINMSLNFTQSFSIFVLGCVAVGFVILFHELSYNSDSSSSEQRRKVLPLLILALVLLFAIGSAYIAGVDRFQGAVGFNLVCLVIALVAALVLVPVLLRWPGANYLTSFILPLCGLLLIAAAFVTLGRSGLQLKPGNFASKTVHLFSALQISVITIISVLVACWVISTRFEDNSSTGDDATEGLIPAEDQVTALDIWNLDAADPVGALQVKVDEIGTSGYVRMTIDGKQVAVTVEQADKLKGGFYLDWVAEEGSESDTQFITNPRPEIIDNTGAVEETDEPNLGAGDDATEGLIPEATELDIWDLDAADVEGAGPIRPNIDVNLLKAMETPTHEPVTFDGKQVAVTVEQAAGLKGGFYLGWVAKEGSESEFITNPKPEISVVDNTGAVEETKAPNFDHSTFAEVRTWNAYADLDQEHTLIRLDGKLVLVTDFDQSSFEGAHTKTNTDDATCIKWTKTTS